MADYRIYASDPNDPLAVFQYDTKITGTKFNNRLQGTNSSDLIYGYGGNDTLIGGNGNDILIGLYAYSGTDRDVLTGGRGVDIYVAGDGDGNYYNDPAGDAIITDYNSSETIVINGNRELKFVAKSVANVGTSSPDLIIYAGNLSQVIIQDFGSSNNLNFFKTDYEGENDLGGVFLV
ncbi:hypothetical protein LC613_15115 [Nostoc sphaeroides CHAB 2801]|uniref:calcium-binding protein n=1 Tax=Nostoc sphaeroides TaxID=446679 RepID=UPI000E4FBFDA|nr:hypothetical protein [Nostoc sphaeroides]MCC5629327.1 hypothetical protein [Nostoc sphaeroides CHAB 2801]